LDSLWGQVIECSAIVGEASGKDKFHKDALEMMSALASLQDELSEGWGLELGLE
jgi:hypothetical protein